MSAKSQKNIESVSESLSSPVLVGNVNSVEQDVKISGPSRTKSPRVKNSVLESLRASLKEEITSEIKGLLLESQKELLKLLKPKTGESIREEDENASEDESRSSYTPTRSMKINFKQINDPCTSGNNPGIQRKKYTLITLFNKEN